VHHHPRTAGLLVADDALDDALSRIAELTGRLHAVADLHAPRRTLLGTRACRACARAFPCPTVQLSRRQAGTSQRTA
jgi:hypothetical protein